MQTPVHGRHAPPPPEFTQAMRAESTQERQLRVGRHAPARQLRRWTQFLPVVVAMLAAAGLAFWVGLEELRDGLWLSVSTSGVTAVGLSIGAGLLFVRMLDRKADQKAAAAAQSEAAPAEAGDGVGQG